MPLTGYFGKQKQKMAAPRPSFHLVAGLTSGLKAVLSFIHLSRARLVSDPVSIVSAAVWGGACVYCIHYGGLKEARAD